MLYVKKYIYLKTPTKQIYIKSKRSEESSRNVCSADLEGSIEKEELYLRKIAIFNVWDYFSSNYEIMFIQLYWIIKTNSLTLSDQKDKLYANIHFL